LDVYPNATLWSIKQGPDRPLVGLFGLRNELNNPFNPLALAQNLISAINAGGKPESVGFDSPESLLARFIAGPIALEKMSKSAKYSTDDFPICEMPKFNDNFQKWTDDNLLQCLQIWEPLDKVQIFHTSKWEPSTLESALKQQFARRILFSTACDWDNKDAPSLLKALNRAKLLSPRDPEVLELLDIIERSVN